MDNPFKAIDLRLSNIENLLLDLKHSTSKQKPLPPKENDIPFLTKKQAAKKLSCSTSTIDNYARAGKLTRHYLGRVVRFKEEEVLDLVKSGH